MTHAFCPQPSRLWGPGASRLPQRQERTCFRGAGTNAHDARTVVTSPCSPWQVLGEPGGWGRRLRAGCRAGSIARSSQAEGPGPLPRSPVGHQRAGQQASTRLASSSACGADGTSVLSRSVSRACSWNGSSSGPLEGQLCWDWAARQAGAWADCLWNREIDRK